MMYASIIKDQAYAVLGWPFTAVGRRLWQAVLAQCTSLVVEYLP